MKEELVIERRPKRRFKLEGRPILIKEQSIKEDKRNSILVIVDAQTDFVRGSLAVDGAEKAMRQLRQYLDENKHKYKRIIFTLDWHPSNHSSFKMWPKHCVQYTKGALLCDELIDFMTDNSINKLVFTKGENQATEEYSIFENYLGRLALTRQIADTNITEIDVCGIAGDFCVLNTVKDMIPIAKEFNSKINVLTPFIAYVKDKEPLMNLIEENKDIINKI